MPVKLNVNLMCELVLDYKLVVFKENLKRMKDQFIFTIEIIDIFYCSNDIISMRGTLPIQRF